MRLRQSIRGARFNFCTLLGGVALFCAVFLAGCGQKEQESSAVPQCGEGVLFEPVGSSFFSIGKLCGVDVAELRSVVGKDSLVHRYVMMDSAAASLGTDLRRRGFPAEWLSAFVLRVPLRRVVALSTSQVGYLLRLGLRDNIIGVSDGNYIVDSYYRTQRGSSNAQTAAVAGAPKFVESIGYDADALEKLMALSPDLIFDFTTGGDYDNYEQIARTSLPLMLTSEWQEDSPLAKLEWIKLYGILFGIRPLADSIYEDEDHIDQIMKDITLKRPRNAYTQFVLSESELLKSKDKDNKIKLGEFNTSCAEKWKKLSSEEKTRYNKLYEEEKLKYKNDLELVRHYLFKDFNENVRRSPTAYHIFVSEKLRLGFEQNLDPKDVKKAAASEWEKMTKEQKQVYKEKQKRSNCGTDM